MPNKPYKEMTRKELKKALQLPLKIYGTLTYVGYTTEGELAIYFKKKNNFMLIQFLKKLRAMVGREVFIHVDEGEWDK